MTELLAVFRVDPNRSRAAFERLMGSDFNGIVGSDRWSAYGHIPPERRALCWAHLKRDFQKLVDRGEPAAELGTAGLDVVAHLFDAWHGFKAGEFDREELLRRLIPVQERLEEALRAGLKDADAKAAAFSKNLLKLRPGLWTFARVEGVEPTNNDAERPLRRGVIWRNISFGADSEGGSRFVERILTAVESLKKQGRMVLDFLEDACRAALTGAKPPSLLPIPDG